MAIEAPFFPIIHVRGYAGQPSEVEDTVATPYMGFNLGATKVRQAWTGEVQRLYFESPLIRLMKDHGYRDVYEGGAELPSGFRAPPRSLFIYRYYDEASEELGAGQRREIEHYAAGLGRLILRVRDRVCGEDAAARRAFRVYLVAHSMGGLITRCFLQNDGLGESEQRGELAEARRLVDKVFTYATPHNGIDLNLIGNVPAFFSRNNADNFNRERMIEYLSLPEGTDRGDVASLDGDFDPDRFFCLVGTNHRDYDVLFGLSSRAVGPMSDGLVRISNATVWGPDAGGGRRQAPRAFIHRAHSGHYGIVNSEEGYQNLTRFLFGDVRVDGVLEVRELSLPPDVQRAHENEKRIRASYHFETIVRVRGARWDLHRRLVSDSSAIFRAFDQMFRPRQIGLDQARHPHLFSAYLSAGRRVNKRRPGLGFCIDLAVHVPEYEVDGVLWFDRHYDGGYLYRDKINLEAVPPGGRRDRWRVRFGFDSRTPNRVTRTIEGDQADDGSMTFRIPISQKTRPGLEADLVLRARPWNTAP